MSGSMRELSLENNHDMTGMVHGSSDWHAKQAPTSSSLFLLGLAHTGTMPVMMFVLLLEGKANMKGCGTLSLPSRADIDSAPVMITDRLSSIKLWT